MGVAGSTRCAADRRGRRASPTPLATSTRNGDLMELVKIWIGAAIAVAIFLAYGSVTLEHEENIESYKVHRCV